jgi:hypothetical protein
MIKNILLLFLLLVSCSKQTATTTFTNPTQVAFDQIKVTCLRWFERDIYFATSDPVVNNRNNQFHKDTVKAALKKLEYNTKLGEDYFRIKEVNADVLDPLMPATLTKNEYKSFILIWEDTKFDSFVTTNISGGLSALPDKNAITVTNAKYQRKYYIILRASCFEASSKCSGSDNSAIGLNGVTALILRQFGLISRIAPVNCRASADARVNIMCADPSDNQWTTDTQNQFYAAFSNQLSVISNNINFYQDAETAASCLPKTFMDKQIYPACPETNRNNIFRILDVYSVLDEISCATILGCNYFNTAEATRNTCISESSINLVLDTQNNVDEPKSYIMIWTDDYLNNWINTNGYSLPDVNAITIVNAAEKSKYKLIFRDSCFDAFNANCDGGNGGISNNGTRALVARQLGQMAGMATRNCNDYPDDVMCSDLPKDSQWSVDSKTRFFNRFNNYLELIGNNPTFYSKQYSTTTTTN